MPGLFHLSKWKLFALMPLTALALAASHSRVSGPDPDQHFAGTASLQLLMEIGHETRDAATPSLAAALQSQRQTLRDRALRPSPVPLNADNIALLKPGLQRQTLDMLVDGVVTGSISSSAGAPVAKAEVVSVAKEEMAPVDAARSDGIEGPKADVRSAEPAMKNIMATLATGAASMHALPAPSPLSGVEGTGPLSRFHAKLAALEAGRRSKPVTVYHFGGSHVASDSFSRGIRKALQKRYGNAGRGMVIPAKAYRFGHADQVAFTSKGSWRSQTARKRNKGRFGISGVAVSSRSSRASMTMTSKIGPFDWAEVTVATGPSQGAFDIQIGAVKKRFDAYAKSRGSQSFRVENKGRSVTVRPAGGAQTTVLNWASGENEPGLRYVNFGLNGARLNITRRMNEQLVANDLKRLDPDLIVYGYGTNEGFDDNLDLKRYNKRAAAYLKQLRQWAPNAEIVIMGASSGLRRKGRKTCAGWSVPPKLNPLRDQMKKLAGQTNAAYWDWSAAMGGTCGINTWVADGLASKDRVHLTPKGYLRSAKAFAAWLMPSAEENMVLVQN